MKLRTLFAVGFLSALAVFAPPLAQKSMHSPKRALAEFVLFAVGISCLVMNAHNPFIYFNF